MLALSRVWPVALCNIGFICVNDCFFPGVMLHAPLSFLPTEDWQVFVTTTVYISGNASGRFFAQKIITKSPFGIAILMLVQLGVGLTVLASAKDISFLENDPVRFFLRILFGFMAGYLTICFYVKGMSRTP